MASQQQKLEPYATEFKFEEVVHVTHVERAAKIANKLNQLLTWKPKKKEKGFGKDLKALDQYYYVWFAPLPLNRDQVRSQHKEIYPTYHKGRMTFSDAFSADSRYGTCCFSLSFVNLLKAYARSKGTMVEKLHYAIFTLASHSAEVPVVWMIFPPKVAVNGLQLGDPMELLQRVHKVPDVRSFVPGSKDHSHKYYNYEIALWMGDQELHSDLVCSPNSVSLRFIPHNCSICVPQKVYPSTMRWRDKDASCDEMEKDFDAVQGYKENGGRQDIIIDSDGSDTSDDDSVEQDIRSVSSSASLAAKFKSLDIRPSAQASSSYSTSYYRSSTGKIHKSQICAGASANYIYQLPVRPDWCGKCSGR
jgi:hypothetical protein